jgi:L-lactate dehydrogenase complex protein LldF
MTTQALHFVPPGDFKARARAALDDPDLRASFRGAMDFLQTKRASQFPDDAEREALRDLGEAIRQHALARLPELLQQLEANLVARGDAIAGTSTRNADEAPRPHRPQDAAVSIEDRQP